MVAWALRRGINYHPLFLTGALAVVPPLTERQRYAGLHPARFGADLLAVFGSLTESLSEARQLHGPEWRHEAAGKRNCPNPTTRRTPRNNRSGTARGGALGTNRIRIVLGSSANEDSHRKIFAGPSDVLSWKTGLAWPQPPGMA